MRGIQWTAILALLLCGVSFGEIYTWKEPKDGKFSDPARWMIEKRPAVAAAHPPGAGDAIAFNAASKNRVTVSFTEDIEVSWLQTGPVDITLKLDGHRFKAHGNPWLIGVGGKVPSTVRIGGGAIESGSTQHVGDITLGLLPEGIGVLEVAGKETTWVHTGTNTASYFAVGTGGKGQFTLSGGATLTCIPGACFSVGLQPTADGKVVVNGKDTTLVAPSLLMSGTLDKAGGDGLLTISAGATVHVAELCIVWPKGVISLEGGALALPVGKKSRLRGTLRGWGTISRAGDTGRFDIENNGTLAAGTRREALVLSDGDYHHGPEGKLTLQLPEPDGGKILPAMEVKGAGCSAVFEAGTVELQLPTRSAPKTGDSLQLVTASQVKIERPPVVRLLGRGSEKLAGELSVESSAGGGQALKITFSGK